MGRMYAQQWAASLFAARTAEVEQRALTAWHSRMSGGRPIGDIYTTPTMEDLKVRHPDWIAGFVAGAQSSRSTPAAL